MGPTILPIRWVPGVLSPEIRQHGRESGHLPQSSAGVKDGEAIHLLPHTSSWRGAQIYKYRNKFTFYVYELREVCVELCGVITICVA
jgi:hypothetical protein